MHTGRRVFTCKEARTFLNLCVPRVPLFIASVSKPYSQIPFINPLHSYSSTINADKGGEALCQSISKCRRHDQEASPGKHRHRMKTHLASDDAWLEEAPIIVRWVGDRRQLRRELSLWEHLPLSPSLAIVDNGTRRASGSMVGKGDSHQNSLKI
jgi:hypothetical protein